ncbi:MAG: PAS domain S-box protein [Promethearchaeota archaeon]
MEENKLSSLKLYEYLVKNSSELIIIIDKIGTIESINAGTLRDSLSYSQIDLLAKKWQELSHPNYKEAIALRFKSGLGQDVHEIPVVNKKGELVDLEVRGTTFMDDQGLKKTILMARDISKRKQYKKLIDEYEINIRIANEKMAFYSNLISCDFNNILQNILSKIKPILLPSEESMNKKKIEDLLEYIKIQSENGTKLVSNIGILSDIETTLPLLKKIDVIKMLTEAIKKKQKEFGNEVHFHIESETSFYYVYANELMYVVFENLIEDFIIQNNADQIEIFIRASIKEVGEKKYLKMEFRNNVKKEEFTRIKNIIENDSKIKSPLDVNLGLFLVKKIIDIYNGNIKVVEKESKEASKIYALILTIPLM